mmetsp:Transcript_2524/g.5896  ORF Transcript_2524/g.5896 Transcript_2524/m.5896 type:complete len:125 (-) Transcript_2524:312-686(-)
MVFLSPSRVETITSTPIGLEASSVNSPEFTGAKLWATAATKKETSGMHYLVVVPLSSWRSWIAKLSLEKTCRINENACRLQNASIRAIPIESKLCRRLFSKGDTLRTRQQNCTSAEASIVRRLA